MSIPVYTSHARSRSKKARKKSPINTERKESLDLSLSRCSIEKRKVLQSEIKRHISALYRRRATIQLTKTDSHLAGHLHFPRALLEAIIHGRERASERERRKKSARKRRRGGGSRADSYRCTFAEEYTEDTYFECSYGESRARAANSRRPLETEKERTRTWRPKGERKNENAIAPLSSLCLTGRRRRRRRWRILFGGFKDYFYAAGQKRPLGDERERERGGESLATAYILTHMCAPRSRRRDVALLSRVQRASDSIFTTFFLNLPLSGERAGLRREKETWSVRFFMERVSSLIKSLVGTVLECLN